MSIQIFILSKLMVDNNYPYKLKKQLSEPIPLDELGGLTESKLYYHFDSLAKKGLIEPVKIIKEEHRPDKQVFAITEKGREALPTLIYKLFEQAEDMKDMVVGLANMKYVNRDQVAEILERKLKNIKTVSEKLNHFEHVKTGDDSEKIREFLSGYFSTRTEHTIEWLEKLIIHIKQEEI
ncbi:PadR family transcriptional regulator [Cytobacillus massiliigabonensis]|uniref:PadR family transcriptional regulator n=1 Tax=Cytobacillus massiliigabonensis TaxID=1871011 RepID=UPI000C8325D3|nr:helix-turn-helix transcriptional regulator [Cytobacillus massiliigabonensis]